MKQIHNIEAPWFGSALIELEVDREVFTDEKAKLINEFWTGAEDRLEECGDVYKTTIRLFGQQFIGYCLEEGGADVGGNFWLDSFLKESEGWGSERAWLGFNIKSIYVMPPSFHEITVE